MKTKTPANCGTFQQNCPSSLKEGLLERLFNQVPAQQGANVSHISCSISYSHLTSSYQEEEFDELESVTLSHPGDRIGDAGLEDEENIQTDWSKIYKVENKVDSEISVAKPSALKRRSLNKNNKVTFMDNPGQTSQKKTVLVELNPAALLLETRLETPLVEEEMEEEVKGMRLDSPVRGHDSSEKELSEDMESDEFNVEKVKSKWLEM